MNNKICLITGANTGIGKATAIELAAMGAIILMVCRNKDKGTLAMRDIIKETGNVKVHLFMADLASFSSVKRIATEILARFSHLDVLINNAAAFYTKHQLTADGIERQFQVNHLSGFLLTHLLMPMLKAAPSARVINVSSIGNYKGDIHFDDINLSDNYSGLKAYRQSKLANVLFTYELARRLRSTEITANTLHPGVVGTQIGFANSRSLEALVWWLGSPFMLSDKQGAATSIYLASSEEVKSTTGEYFEKSRSKRSSERSYDLEMANRLWELSVQLCKIEKGI